MYFDVIGLVAQSEYLDMAPGIGTWVRSDEAFIRAAGKMNYQYITLVNVKNIQE